MNGPRIPPRIKAAARELRREMTPTEQRLWRHLRRRNLDGLRFRRQHPIGRFIVDFYCVEQQLIIELDGEVHKYQGEYDAMRSEWLIAQGYRLLRFPNEAVWDNLEGVLAVIREYVAENGL